MKTNKQARAILDRLPRGGVLMIATYQGSYGSAGHRRNCERCHRRSRGNPYNLGVLKTRPNSRVAKIGEGNEYSRSTSISARRLGNY